MEGNSEKADKPDERAMIAQELEQRVRIAELRAREAEAEVRLFEANSKKLAFTADKNALVKKYRKKLRSNRRNGKKDARDEVSKPPA